MNDLLAFIQPVFFFLARGEECILACAFSSTYILLIKVKANEFLVIQSIGD